MSGFSTNTNDHLIRANLWSAELKDVLYDDLYATQFVKWIGDFPDGDTLNIPSIGQLEAQDYEEDDSVNYTSLDTGNFTFTIDTYLSSATYITEKMKQDSYYMSQLTSSFVPKQARAIATRMEGDFLAKGPEGQTAANLNTINGGDHRFVGSDTANSVRTIGMKDFAKARYALKQANVPDENLIAIVDPSVEYHLNTLTNLVDVSNNPKWEGVITEGLGKGMKFMKNIYGFDVYTSQHLKVNAASETIDSVAVAAGGVNNIFFSAAPDVLPIVGAVRQAPKVDSEFNKDRQREEFVTTTRYAFKLYRPENFVTVLSDTDVIV